MPNVQKREVGKRPEARFSEHGTPANERSHEYGIASTARLRAHGKIRV